MAIQDLGTRLRHARKIRRASQVAVANAAGITQPSVSEIESGETKELGAGVLIAICAFLKVRPEWMVTGKGPMDISAIDDLSEDERELLDRYRQATGRWKVAIIHMAALRGDANQDEAADSMNYVLAKIAATPVADYRLGKNWTRPDKKEDD